MRDLFQRLSPRARAWLERVGYEHGYAVLGDAEIRERFSANGPNSVLERGLRDGHRLVEALVSFERSYGDFSCDPETTNLELGLGRLEALGIDVEFHEELPLVLIGTEEHADLWLDEYGALWSSGPDRVVGELAGSVEAYLERLATLEPVGDRYVVWAAPDTAMVELLGLVVDRLVTDATYLRATSDECVLERALLGTAWRKSRTRLIFRDFDALVRGLARLQEGIPAFSASVSSDPAARSDRIDRALAPAVSDLAASFASRADISFPSEHGRVYVSLDPPLLEAYELGGEGHVAEQLRLEHGDGRVIRYYVPWPSS